MFTITVIVTFKFVVHVVKVSCPALYQMRMYLSVFSVFRHRIAILVLSYQGQLTCCIVVFVSFM